MEAVNVENTKICGTCKKEFPKTTDYFFARVIKKKNKRGLVIYHSFRSDCKNCHAKKTNERIVKKRCQELNCNISDYRENWKTQYSETRTIDAQAKNELTEGQYNVYIKMLSKGIVNNLEEYRKEVFKNKYSKPWMRKFDYGGKVFLTEKERQNKNNITNREKITDRYIVNALGFKKGEVPKQIIETKRLIINLKRELKNNNVKIK